MPQSTSVCGTVVQNLHPGANAGPSGPPAAIYCFPKEAALARLDCVADDGLGDAARGVRGTPWCHSAVYVGKLP